MFDNEKQEQAVMLAVHTPQVRLEKTEMYLEELSFLIQTAGGNPVKQFIQNLSYPDPRTYFGAGRLDEVKQFVEQNEIGLAVFDDELSPSQLRNIETILQCKIMDRTHLILDIFAKHAQTAHSKTQVELAQYEYLLPRLTRMWTHLSKQRGGIGMRGPGEQEIETDRRIIRNRISLLKSKLKEIDKQKSTQRGNREHFVRVALVGYTNVGKSTLMNMLGKSEVLVENKLFATLDTTVRKVVIQDVPFLLSDTVGFIRKLPHGLIESFKSTLDEVRESDLLIHVVDISHPDFEEQIEVVNQTIAEIDKTPKQTILVFNKIDAYKVVEKEEDDLTPMKPENYTLEYLEKTWMAKTPNPCVFMSARNKQNIEELKALLYKEISLLRDRKLYNKKS